MKLERNNKIVQADRPRMTDFEAYVRVLESHAVAALEGQKVCVDRQRLSRFLNGETGAELRRCVPLADRQSIGAFFTGESLRSRAIGPRLNGRVSGTIWDPACGAGDLLLGYGEKLPIYPDIGQTLIDWGKRIGGNDTEEIFLRAAKARLVLAAYSRGARKIATTKLKLSLDEVFPLLQCENSLEASLGFEPTEIVLNPPFVSIKAPERCEWGSGNISAAAQFVDSCLKVAKSGSRIIAILPDVLRAGSRYGHWRKYIQEFAAIERVDVYGSFDPQADVDVFILELKVREARLTSTGSEEPWGVRHKPSSKKLADYCTVAVGAVVPHRDKEIGLEYAYLHSRDAPPWERINSLSSRRKFAGTTFQPPFVVIRRTSSPSDKFRALGTLVNCSEPVAVENHLLICKPHDGTVKTCKAILETLKSPATNEWLNSRIRCRHLTVGAVRDIPWET
ncbi:MAG: hypothetical protein PHH47_05320 [Gallionella sp.]|nr:hypothetical protein [Gallionella sp.]MDD4945502.1 hypothetical protein [Gallionella sp.]